MSPYMVHMVCRMFYSNFPK